MVFKKHMKFHGLTIVEIGQLVGAVGGPKKAKASAKAYQEGRRKLVPKKISSNENSSR